MNIGEALQKARHRIAPISESPGLDAQVLLAEVLGVDRAYVLAYPEIALDEAQADRFTALVERAAAGEPIPYLLGRRAFYDMDLTVPPTVLIPRPETELLLEQAIEWANGRRGVTRAVDVGTGSGALAVGLAKHCPRAEVYAVDLSSAALEVARANAAGYGVESRIQFLQSDLLDVFLQSHIKFDLVMANLPYIPSHEVLTLRVSRYEPRLALDGGVDGLVLIRRLLTQLPTVTIRGALALLEISAVQGEAALALARHLLQPQSAQVLKDYARLDRIVRLVL
jgi:release factor glutamine methyltransferase